MKKISKIILGFLASFLIITVLLQFLLKYNVISNYFYSIILYVFGIVSLIIYISVKILKRYKFDYFDYLILILILLGLVSVQFSINSKIALFGFTNRNEGLFSLVSYYSLFLISRLLTNKERKIFIKSLVWIGIIQILFVLFEISNLNIFWNYSEKPYVISLLTNKSFFGTFCVLGYGLTLGLFFENYKYLPLNLCYLLGVFLSGTLSAFLGIFAVIICSLFLNFRQIKDKRYILLIGTSIALFLLYQIFDNQIILDMKQTFKELLFVVDHQSVQVNFGNFRIFIWENIFKILPQHFFFGIGIDNLPYAFGSSPLYIESLGLFVDKAHNEYLQIFITEGFLAFIMYLILYVSILIKAFFSLKSNQILVLAIIGYLVQAIFNISVIQVAPIFFILLGLTVTVKAIKKDD